MNSLGGFFSYDDNKTDDSFFDSIRHEDWDLKYTMSGRCAIYYALEDLKKQDRKRCAYLPAYTCSTVLAPYKKAGYEICFYEIDRTMTPVFDPAMTDRISVLSLCGYYGFCRYDRDFVKSCRDHGIAVIEDTTHSIFSADGIDENCDYIVGSLRKWIGVPSGGFAIKTTGVFQSSLTELHEEHLRLRRLSMELKARHPDSHEHLLQANKLFWDAEMLLRRIYDARQSDADSVRIMNTFDYKHLISRRRENYRYLLEHLEPNPQYVPVFPELDCAAVPSHFTIYVTNRRQVQDYLNEKDIHATVYWPVNEEVDFDRYPNAKHIYDHVLSLPCDQRYGPEQMQMICDALDRLPLF